MGGLNKAGGTNELVDKQFDEQCEMGQAGCLFDAED